MQLLFLGPQPTAEEAAAIAAAIEALGVVRDEPDASAWRRAMRESIRED